MLQSSLSFEKHVDVLQLKQLEEEVSRLQARQLSQLTQCPCCTPGRGLLPACTPGAVVIAATAVAMAVAAFGSDTHVDGQLGSTPQHQYEAQDTTGSSGNGLHHTTRCEIQECSEQPLALLPAAAEVEDLVKSVRLVATGRASDMPSTSSDTKIYTNQHSRVARASQG